MKTLAAFKKIQSLGTPIFQISDIAITLGLSNQAGYKILKALEHEKLIVHLRRGLWGLTDQIDPLMLPDYLTAPMPSYISLQSALYYHGMISQIPAITYAISIARTRQYNTFYGLYSIHHINPILFSGFEITSNHSIRMAQAEKALFDFFI